MYCQLFHLLFGPTVMLIFDVEVQCQSRSVFFFTVIETTLKFFIQLILGPADKTALIGHELTLFLS